jgi:hypothetical protein
MTPAVLSQPESLEGVPVGEEAASAASEGQAESDALRLSPGLPETADSRNVSFYGWLFNEKTIKFALYTGAFLLLLAGTVFVRSHWGEMPGESKFAILLLVTGLLYLCGYWLFQDQRMRLGGIALIGLASGFAPLNFAILQIYVLGPQGFNGRVMFLLASLTCLFLYSLTVAITRADLFSYLGIAALAGALLASMELAGFSEQTITVCFLLLALALLLSGTELRKTNIYSFTGRPMVVSAHLAVPILLAFVILGMLFEGSSWLILSGILVGAVFYLAADLLYQSQPARWCAAILILFLASVTLEHLNVPSSQAGPLLMILPALYLPIGRIVKLRDARRYAGLPFYAAAYCTAAWLTFHPSGVSLSFLLVLLADVFILAESWIIHGRVAWLYGAAWLFILPFCMALDLYVPDHVFHGLLAGVLAVNYFMAGYLLGREEVQRGSLPYRGGPFLSAAAGSSVIMVALSWNYPIMAAVLSSMAAVYFLFISIWLDRPPFLLPAFLALDAAVFSLMEAFFSPDDASLTLLGGVYSLVAIGLLLVGILLKSGSRRKWAGPFYVFGFLNMAGSYFVSFGEEVLAAVLSAVYSLMIFRMAFLEKPGRASLMTYLSFFFTAVGLSLILKIAGLSSFLPPVLALLGCTFVYVSGVSGKEQSSAFYVRPLFNSGLVLIVLSGIQALLSLNYVNVTVTFAFFGLLSLLEAGRRKKHHIYYLSAPAFLVVYWAVLVHHNAGELQAYVMPPGLLLILFGWIERRRLNEKGYDILTRLGILSLMGTLFLQYLGSHNYAYAVLLGIESMASAVLGIRIRSRLYLGWGVIALVLDALSVLGPGVLGLDRWLQLALTGAVLLGGGLAVLFKRDEISRNYEKLNKEWKRWDG